MHNIKLASAACGTVTIHCDKKSVKLTPKVDDERYSHFEFFVSKTPVTSADAFGNAAFLGAGPYLLHCNAIDKASELHYMIRPFNGSGKGRFIGVSFVGGEWRFAGNFGFAQPSLSNENPESTHISPAITVTERIGDAEIVTEFATAADYAAWKELQ